MTKTLTDRELRQFTGSERFFRHPLNRSILYTEGVRYVAEHAGAYWLIDAIAANCRHEPSVAAEGFQAWKLTVDLAAHTGSLVCEDGNSREVYRQELEFTDFPRSEITLWAVENEFGPGHYTIMLPSEY